MTKYSTKAEAVAAYMLFYPLSASSQISVGKVGGRRNATTLGDRRSRLAHPHQPHNEIIRRAVLKTEIRFTDGSVLAAFDGVGMAWLSFRVSNAAKVQVMVSVNARNFKLNRRSFSRSGFKFYVSLKG